jgi:signal transduction histidine kinase
MVILLTVSCLPLTVRSRFPLAVVVLTAAVTAVGYPLNSSPDFDLPPVACAIALYSLASRTDRRTAFRTAACTAVGLTVAALVLRPGTERLGMNLGVLAWTLLAVAIGDSKRNRRELLRSAVERAEHAERTKEEEALRRVTEERIRIARELHDVVAHHIAGILLQTQAARITARRQQDPDALDATLEEIEAAGGEALAAMRRVVGLLRDTDDGVTTGTGTEQLTALVKRFDGHGPAVTLVLPEPQDASWPPEVASTVYRVVQESLTNIARHAVHARSACVEIARDAHGVTIEVTDDAQPGSPRSRHRGGFGLVGMRERVEALGGTLKAGPRPAGAGWTVTATLPVPGERR